MSRLGPWMTALPPWRERPRRWRMVTGTGLVVGYAAGAATLSYLLTTSLVDGTRSGLPAAWRPWILVAMLLPVPAALMVDARE